MSNIKAISFIIFTEYYHLLIIASLILLLGMVSTIVLTLQKKFLLKNQTISIPQNEKIFVSGNQYSRLGPFSHIEFLSEHWVVDPNIKYTISNKNSGFSITSKRFLVVDEGLKDIKYGSLIELNENKNFVYDSIKNNILILSKKELKEYINSIDSTPSLRNFYNSKAHIEQTPLYKLLKTMPKGGILHLHSGAMGNPRWVAQKAIDTREMHVFWEATNDKYAKGQLQAYAKDKAPKGFRPAYEIAKTNPNFATELVDLLTFDESIDFKLSNHSQNVIGIYNKLFKPEVSEFSYDLKIFNSSSSSIISLAPSYMHTQQSYNPLPLYLNLTNQ